MFFVFFNPASNLLLAPSSNTQSLRFERFGSSTMFGSDLQGRWMPSSVTEEDVLKLHEAKYLSYEISHRLPSRPYPLPSPVSTSSSYPSSVGV